MSALAMPVAYDQAPGPGELQRASVATGMMNILHLMDHLPWFRGMKGHPVPASWASWRVFLKAVYGLPMDDQEVGIYQRHTGRKDPPAGKVTEVWGGIGRRGRKSAVMALIGTWEGGLLDHSYGLAPGERGRIPMIAKDKDDAQQMKSYVLAILNCAGLAWLKQGDPTAEEIQLTTGIDLKIRACSLTAGRVKASPAALLDEVAFWTSDDSAAPAEEVVAGIRPSMSTFESPLIVGMSSVYDKRGLLWEMYREHYRNENDSILFWQATTGEMHDSPIIRAFIEKQMQEDPVAARAEFLSEWRTDIGPYVDPEKVDAATVKGRTVLSYDAKRPQVYWAFCDPSGGSQDEMALGVAHREGDVIVLDYANAWPCPFDPDTVVDEQALVIKSYGLEQVWGDQVGGVWLRKYFDKRGIQYALSPEPKSKLYRDALPGLNANRIQLLDHEQCNRQIKKLERRVSRAGDIIDHPPGSHDDVANAAMGSVWLADNYGLHRVAPDPEEPPAQTTHEIVRRQIQAGLKKDQDRGSRRVSSPRALRDWMRRGR